MAAPPVPKFKNDDAVPVIEVGVHELHCTGASAPHDHPHVYLDMGDEDEIVCPYCSTLFRYKATLAPDECVPASAKVPLAAVGPDRR